MITMDALQKLYTIKGKDYERMWPRKTFSWVCSLAYKQLNQFGVGLVKSATKIVSGCTRTTKVYIFALCN